jgi:hypothetical protein
MPLCSCRCTCQFRNNEVTVQANSHQQNLNVLLARKPTIENGQTTDQYDDGEFELIEEQSRNP